MGEEVHEAEPDDLERQQHGSREAGRTQEAQGSRRQHTRPRLRRGFHTGHDATCEPQAACRSHQVGAGSYECRAAHPKTLDQRDLTDQTADDGPERVPAVEATQRRAKARIARGEHSHQQRQGGSHRGRRQCQHHEAHHEPQRVHQPRLLEQRAQQGNQRRRETRQAEHHCHPAGSDRDFECGVGTQRFAHARAKARRQGVSQPEPGHEARKHQTRGPEAVAKREPRLAKPQRLEEETRRTRQEEDAGEHRRHVARSPPNAAWRARRPASILAARPNRAGGSEKPTTGPGWRAAQEQQRLPAATATLWTRSTGQRQATRCPSRLSLKRRIASGSMRRPAASSKASASREHCTMHAPQ